MVDRSGHFWPPPPPPPHCIAANKFTHIVKVPSFVDGLTRITHLQELLSHFFGEFVL